MAFPMKRGESSRCLTNTSRIPGDDIVVSAGQIAHKLAVAKDKVNTGSTRSPYRTSERGVAFRKMMGEGGPGLVRRTPFLGELVAPYLATASLAFPADSLAQSRGTSK